MIAVGVSSHESQQNWDLTRSGGGRFGLGGAAAARRPGARGGNAGREALDGSSGAGAASKPN